MAKELSDKELVVKTRETIEKYGWANGVFGDTSFGFCLVGAADHAIDGGRTYWIQSRLERILLPFINNDRNKEEVVNITDYNDSEIVDKEACVSFLLEVEKTL